MFSRCLKGIPQKHQSPSDRRPPPRLDLTIKASGTNQGLIQDVGTVGGSDHHHTLATAFDVPGVLVVQDEYGHKHMAG